MSSAPSHAPSTSVTFISKCTIFPELELELVDDITMFDRPIKLSISDLPMLSCHYIQKGLLFPSSPHPTEALLALLKTALSKTLSHFPPLSGRLVTDPDGIIYVTPCRTGSSSVGVDFMHASALHVSLNDVMIISPDDVVKDEFFPFNGAVSYDGHLMPLMAVQVTELLDGVFIGCAANHAVVDGTSFWNFFNAFADTCRAATTTTPTRIPRPLDFRRNFVKDSQAVLSFDNGKPPTVTFDVDAPLTERMFHFSKQAIVAIKSRANAHLENNSEIKEQMGKVSNDVEQVRIMSSGIGCHEISSFQSLCAQVWRAVTRARNLDPSKPTTFRMAINCRHRLRPKLDWDYFGNAIQSVPTVASAGEVLSRDLCWTADMLRRGVAGHDDAAVRRIAEEWERLPRLFPLGNFDGATVTMGSSPRFPMYDNDFGWGRPVAVRSGRANKFDGKMSAFPGREGDGSVDLEVCLEPETMAGIEKDEEFMHYVSDWFVRDRS
ncbi:hypothetical protein Sjap_014045 [Stephania japonica]|uniref:Uncharacterized protein n=1 Tax=Stephania japonica TaxID=461633 RepID=A0AAP0J0W4_9MAGN